MGNSSDAAHVSATTAINEDLFRWLMERQNMMYATLLGVDHC